MVEYVVKYYILVVVICNVFNFMVENGYLDNIEYLGNILDYMEL